MIIRRVTSGHVDTRDRLHARQDARGIIEDARLRCKEMLARAQRDAESRLRAGWDEGFRSGLDALAEQLRAERARIEATFEQDMFREVVDLAARFATVLLEQELGTRPEAILPALERHVREALAHAQSFSITLHPGDAATVEASKAQMEKRLGASIAVRSDESVTRGSWIITTTLGVEYRRDVRLTVQRYSEAVLQRFRETHGAQT